LRFNLIQKNGNWAVYGSAQFSFFMLLATLCPWPIKNKTPSLLG